VSGSAYKTNQSIRGGLARLDLSPEVTFSLWLAVTLFLVVAFVRGARRADPTVAVIAAGLLALLISPTSWSDHWVWVAPGLLLMAARAHEQASRAWLGAAAVTTAVAVLAPFKDLPGANQQELSWTTWQHIIGNSYLLLGVILLLVFALRPPQPSPCADGAQAWGKGASVAPRQSIRFASSR
jgi:alpha-1,2-mannosyltransferase